MSGISAQQTPTRLPPGGRADQALYPRTGKQTSTGYHAVAPWAPHDRTWMAWPSDPLNWGPDFGESLDQLADLARTIASFEPVTLLCRPPDVADLSIRCGNGIDILPMQQAECPIRDLGPTFLAGPGGRLGGIDWARDRGLSPLTSSVEGLGLAQRILDHVGADRFAPALRAEAGALSWDGDGTAIALEPGLLNPERNPDLDRDGIDAILAAQTGAQTIIWLPDAMTNDPQGGTLSLLAQFLAPGKIALSVPADIGDPDYLVAQAALDRLFGATDAAGRQIEIVPLPTLRPLVKNGRRIARSYAGFCFVNGGLLIPSFGDPADDQALRIVRRHWPERKIIQVEAELLALAGASLSCMTLPQPRLA